MDKRRLLTAIDLAMVLTVFMLIRDNIGIPYPRSIEKFWEMRREIFRTGAAVLWLVALWLNLYAAWDGAARVSKAALAWGAALVVCVLSTHYFTRLIIESYKARLSQALYGISMLITAAVSCMLQKALEAANPDCPECVAASVGYRRALTVAFDLLALGLAVSFVRFRAAAWYAVVAASVWLILTWCLRKGPLSD